MIHPRECPKCGTIGVWNWAQERKLKTMPNGETVKAKVIVEGEPEIKCPKCGHKFQLQGVYEKLNAGFERVAKGISEKKRKEIK